MNTPMDERRERLLLIRNDFLMDLLTGQLEIVFERCDPPLPRDVQLVRACWNFEQNGLWLALSHPSFAIVEPGSYPMPVHAVCRLKPIAAGRLFRQD